MATNTKKVPVFAINANSGIYPQKTVNINIPDSAFNEVFPNVELPTSEPTLENAQVNYTITNNDITTFTPSIKSFLTAMLFQIGFTNSSGATRTVTLKIYKNGILVDTITSGNISASYNSTIWYSKQILSGLVSGDIVQIKIYASGVGVTLYNIFRIIQPVKWKLEEDNSLIFNITPINFNVGVSSAATSSGTSTSSSYLLNVCLSPQTTSYIQAMAITTNPLACGICNPNVGVIVNSLVDQTATTLAWYYNASGFARILARRPTVISYQASSIKIVERSQ